MRTSPMSSPRPPRMPSRSTSTASFMTSTPPPTDVLESVTHPCAATRRPSRSTTRIDNSVRAPSTVPVGHDAADGRPTPPHPHEGNRRRLNLPDAWTPNDLLGATITLWTTEWLTYYE